MCRTSPVNCSHPTPYLCYSNKVSIDFMSGQMNSYGETKTSSFVHRNFPPLIVLTVRLLLLSSTSPDVWPKTWNGWLVNSTVEVPVSIQHFHGYWEVPLSQIVSRVQPNIYLTTGNSIRGPTSQGETSKIRVSIYLNRTSLVDLSPSIFRY